MLLRSLEKKEAERSSHCSLQLPEERKHRDRSIISMVTDDMTSVNSRELCRGGITRKNFGFWLALKVSGTGLDDPCRVYFQLN